MPIPNGFVLVDPPPRWLVEWCAEAFPERKIEEVYESHDGKRLRFVWSGGERKGTQPRARPAPTVPVPERAKGAKRAAEADLFENQGRRKR